MADISLYWSRLQVKIYKSIKDDNTFILWQNILLQNFFIIKAFLGSSLWMAGKIIHFQVILSGLHNRLLLLCYTDISIKAITFCFIDFQCMVFVLINVVSIQYPGPNLDKMCILLLDVATSWISKKLFCFKTFKKGLNSCYWIYKSLFIVKSALLC